MVTDVFFYHQFIQPERTDTVPSSSKVHPGDSLVFENLAMDSHRTFAFQKPNYKRDAEFRWNAQTHVNVVRH
jgi:hypothetical protein